MTPTPSSEIGTDGCWMRLAEQVLAGHALTRDEAAVIVATPTKEIDPLLLAARRIRERYFDRRVRIHVIMSARGGLCSEDCAYCAQAAAATPSRSFALRDAATLLDGARAAAKLGAYRYCMIASGRSPSDVDLAALCESVRHIKQDVSIDLCVSLGLLDESRAIRLRESGVDRYNHNLETSERFFPSICTTHTYADRLATARAVKRAGLSLCSGGIIGLGETVADRIELAFALRDVRADSIPVNFFDPRPGTPLADRPRPSAADALRTLALFRFCMPEREIRMAGGREACLGNLQDVGLWLANSLFVNGYLTTDGQGYAKDRDLIERAGFYVDSITAAAT